MTPMHIKCYNPDVALPHTCAKRAFAAAPAAAKDETEEIMARQYWKGGNMLYPLPAVMVSCKRPGERANIITIAWTGTVCSDPPMLSISVKPERYSYDILCETREFVVNLVDKKNAFAMDFCGVRSGRDVDKFKEMHLHAVASKTVSCPSIEECPVGIECAVKDIIHLGSHDMFLAEVTAVSINDAFLDENGKFDMGSMGLVAYDHGEYFTMGDAIGRFGYSVKKSK